MRKEFKPKIDIIEFSARVALSLSFLSYGYSKLNGTMFHNKLPGMETLPLSKVDMFHLTWYWFDKNVQLSVFIGITQIIAAFLLLFNRTKLIGAIMSLPLLIGILLIDVFCAQSAGLTGRVLLYVFICIGVLYRNRIKLKQLLSFNEGLIVLKGNAKARVITIGWLVLGVLLFQVIEILVAAMSNLCFKAVSA